MNQQDQDFNYFLENMENLYKSHGHKFVAVKNLSILGVYDNFNKAFESTLETEELGTFLIQECFDNKEKMVHYFQGNVMPVSA
jgi:fibrillarin-like rRNA methylase